MVVLEGGGEGDCARGSGGIPKLALGVGANRNLVWRLKGNFAGMVG